MIAIFNIILPEVNMYTYTNQILTIQGIREEEPRAACLDLHYIKAASKGSGRVKSALTGATQWVIQAANTANETSPYSIMLTGAKGKKISWANTFKIPLVNEK